MNDLLAGFTYPTDLSVNYDGGTVRHELPGGYRLTLRVVPDDTPAMEIINGCDVWGKLEWTRRNDYGSVRPDGFDGTARIIDTDYPCHLWWQPYPGSETVDADSDAVVQLLAVGFWGVKLKLEGPACGVHSCGDTCREELGEASLWGIDSIENGYLAEVANDLVAEIHEQVKDKPDDAERIMAAMAVG